MSSKTNERLRLGQLLRPLARRPRDLLLVPLALYRLQDARCEGEQVGHGLVGAAVPQLLERVVERVVVRDSGGRLDHVRERRVRDAFAVRKGAAEEHRGALEAADELVREPALSDTRVAVDREEMGAVVPNGSAVGVLEQLELFLPADERRLPDAWACAAARDTNDAPGPDGLGPATDLDGPFVLDLEPAEREPVRAGADHDAVDRCVLLKPRGDVDGLPGRECGLRRIVDDHLARLDPDPDVEPELPDGLEHPERRAYRALRVVLVRLRDAERRHDRVAGELLDEPAVGHDAMGDLVEVLLDAPARDLRIGSGDHRCRADEIDEQDCCELTLHPSSVERTEGRKLPLLGLFLGGSGARYGAG